MNKMSAILFAGVLLVGCGGTEDGNANVDPNGFPAVEAGYTRYVVPEILGIQPGTDRMWCQYVSKPFEEDTDVLDFTGWQSAGGHHLIMNATKTVAPVGTSRECTDSDMTAIRFLGGIGGEGASAIGEVLPDGAHFRIPKGYALMANTHFLNASSAPIDGKGYLDIKLIPADPAAKTVAMFVNIDQNISVAPHQAGSLDATCVVEQELELYLFGNHLHEFGKSIKTEITRTSGVRETIISDEVWAKELTFNPRLVSWAVNKPLKLGVGDTVQTHCEWNNTSAEELGFPREMCVGFGIYLGAQDLYCIDGKWNAK